MTNLFLDVFRSIRFGLVVRGSSHVSSHVIQLLNVLVHIIFYVCHFAVGLILSFLFLFFSSLAAAAVDARHRRKSGDGDVDVLAGSPSRHKSGAIFEAFRPRSKSDATRAMKRPTIMTTVKNAVHVLNRFFFYKITVSMEIKMQLYLL